MKQYSILGSKFGLIAHAIKLTRQQKWFDIEQNVKKRKLLFSF